MNQLIVEKSTPFCTFQDQGRFGVRHLGVTQGGAADWVSMSWANWLLGNELNATVIEVAMGGFCLKSSQRCQLAIAGADLNATINGVKVEANTSFEIKENETLTLSHPLSGQRAYIAVPGGFDVPQTLGSSSTVARERLGGSLGDGGAIRAADILQFSTRSEISRVVNPQLLLPPSLNLPLDVVIGAQLGQFSGQATFDFFNSDWEVDTRADRMGIRLLGPALDYCGQALVSEGIPLGAIQVPPDGQPIILMNDRQTIGGYPRIGALTPISVARLSQMSTGSKLRFKAVTQEHAAAEHQRFVESRWV
ncbi:biotin-dependent carboxyltransferase family protein [Pseudomonas sp. 18.1.10]|uniref:5-oxoprolinase subunit C family protein n=1 Tax=Pseudomonas sp. 18.1.10 TaxID=2969302 RepID=UPI00214FEE6B|nr:biotin-dependent carboxyltransferase family protein [Pseudomonas sp. 18.1.10]MCR4536894.1 biotin-dependent carboxyltransferase family protein [Pseudomonas sp. 18.1.10]